MTSPPVPVRLPGPSGPIHAARPLSALETAVGMAFGREPQVNPPGGPSAASPMQALESVIRRGLAHPPCLVSFSGGRDSSALLALAVDVARRDGLPLPIPITLRFAAGETEETAWQELVIGHLGIEDWTVLDVGDELDVVGPVATAVIANHGPTWPVNAYVHAPMFAAAAGGTFITGFGGDELGLASQHAYAGQVLGRRRRPRLPDLPILGLAASPRVVRRSVHRRRAHAALGGFSWLTRDAVAAASAASADDDADLPVSWSGQLEDYFRTNRYFAVTRHNFDVLARAHRTAVLHPFVEDEVLFALARAGGIGGFGSRTALLRALFGELLPERTLRRQSKAVFTSPLWTDTAAAFATEWSGGGIDTALVDVDALRTAWSDPGANTRAWFLLQVAWHHDHPLN